MPAQEDSAPPLQVHPLALFCAGPQSRIDDAVSQGLSILAGLALWGSMGSDRGRCSRDGPHSFGPSGWF